MNLLIKSNKISLFGTVITIEDFALSVNLYKLEQNVNINTAIMRNKKKFEVVSKKSDYTDQT